MPTMSLAELDALSNPSRKLMVETAQKEAAGGAWYDPLLRALEPLGRPVSAIMSVPTNAMLGQSISKGVADSLSGRDYFGVYDLATSLGADPESPVTKWGSLAGDILNPLDPLNYVGVGYIRKGEKAVDTVNALRKIGGTGNTLVDAAKGIDRAAAAKAGAWGLHISIPGTGQDIGLLPKAVNVPLATGVQKTTDAITGSRAYKKLRTIVGPQATGEYGDFWREQNRRMGDKRLIEEDAALRHDEIIKASGLTDSEANAYITFREQPELYEKYATGQDFEMTVGRAFDSNDAKAMLKKIEPWVKAQNRFNDAYSAVASASVGTLTKRVNEWTPAKYESVPLSEFVDRVNAQGGVYRSPEEYLTQLFQNPADSMAHAAAYTEGGVFEGILRGSRASGDAAEDIRKVQRRLETKAGSQNKMTWGWQSPADLADGTEPRVLISSGGQLAPDLKGIGGPRQPFDTRKAAVLAALPHVEDYVRKGGKLSDKDALWKSVNSAMGRRGVNRKTVERIADAVEARMWTSHDLPGDFGPYAELRAQWYEKRAFGDPVERWKFEQNVFNTRLKEINERITEIAAGHSNSDMAALARKQLLEEAMHPLEMKAKLGPLDIGERNQLARDKEEYDRILSYLGGQRDAWSPARFKNDPFPQSVVRGADGKLMPVYHGTTHVFSSDEFDSSKLLTGEGTNNQGAGFFVTTHPDVGNFYSDNNSKIARGRALDYLLNDDTGGMAPEVMQAMREPNVIRQFISDFNFRPSSDFGEVVAKDFFEVSDNKFRRLRRISEPDKEDVFHVISEGKIGDLVNDADYLHYIEGYINDWAFGGADSRIPQIDEIADGIAGSIRPNLRKLFVNLRNPLSETSPLTPEFMKAFDNAVSGPERAAKMDPAQRIASLREHRPDITAWSLLEGKPPELITEVARKAGYDGISYIGGSSGVRNFVVFDGHNIVNAIGRNLDELDPPDVLGIEQAKGLAKEADDIRKAMEGTNAEFGASAYFKEMMDRKGRPSIDLPTETIKVANRLTPEKALAVQELTDAMAPLWREMTNGYAKRGAAWAGDQDRYVPHVPEVGDKGVKPVSRDNFERIREAATQEAIANNPMMSMEEIAKLVESDMTEFKGYFGNKVGTGDADAFLRRKYPFSIMQVNQGNFPFKFEEDARYLFNRAFRTYSNWAYGFDSYTEAVRQFGKTADQIPASQLADWKPVHYLNPQTGKNVFEGKYIPKRVDNIIQGANRAAGAFTSDEGIGAVFGALHQFRRWWSAWTLAPFPAYHARNLIGDAMLAYNGGLNPITPEGMASYAAAADVMMPSFGKKSGAMDSLAQSLSQAFGKPLTADEITNTMKRDNIIGLGLRDLDYEFVAKEVADRMKRSGQRATVTNVMKSLVDIRHDKNLMVRAGFRLGRKIQDTTHAALYLDRMKKVAAMGGVTFEQAAEDARAWVHRHLYDYTDLTPFEQNYAKLLVPFYTWTSRNIPHMLSVAIRDPAKMRPYMRMIQGAYDQNEGVEAGDMPEFLEAMGIPIHSFKNEDGEEEYAVFSPRGWVPAYDIIEFAEVFRHREGGVMRWIFQQLNPVLKEPIEQALDLDTFRGRKISENGVKDMWGIPVPPQVGHILNNFRVVGEMDRLNPGGIFQSIGMEGGYIDQLQALRGKEYYGWVGERPHRLESEEYRRWLRFATGMNFYDVDRVESLQRKTRDAAKEMEDAEYRAKNAARQGNMPEREHYIASMEKARKEALAAMQRLNELTNEKRRERAVRLAGS